MVLFIIALILLVVGVLTLIFRRFSYEDYGKTKTFPVWPAGALFVPLAVLLLLLGSAKTVSANSVGVPQTFGHIGADLKPGVHFVAPWTSVTTYSLRLQSYTVAAATNEGQVAGNDAVNVRFADQGTAGVDATVNYYVNETDAGRLFHRFSSMSNLQTTVVRPAVKAAIQDQFGKFSAKDATTTSRDAIAAAVQAELKPVLATQGVTLDSVTIRDILLSAQLDKALQAVVVAEQNASAAQARQVQAKTDAETAAIQAKGEADANNAKSKSISPALLCQHFIDQMATLKVPVFANPCGTVGNGPAPTVILTTK